MKAPKPTDSTAAVVRQPATDRARQSESNGLGHWVASAGFDSTAC